MDNPFFDAWFSAQARDPNSFVVDICSTKQINTHWRQWVDNTTPRPDNHSVHFGTNNAMQHVKAALRHRVFRDNLLANATPSMAAKYRDFERRALQVFLGLDNPNPPLGTLPAALQPYLYCLAHPSAKSWMAKFEVQHDLSLAPSYVKPFVPFDLPSATGVNPSHITGEPECKFRAGQLRHPGCALAQFGRHSMALLRRRAGKTHGKSPGDVSR